ncbi:46 kDa FK506-binding nuclear protein [Trichonephila clavata]|uniref:peptidylprolyl isomerase n=1 Tax=Trichonephila clavata TaxID=2740835 RepID=A0A8X6EZB8_TRICU|nr:46 kDa FK506-binding nuclear protein [Trichonephila clavata]
MKKNSATDNPSSYRSSFWGVCCESGKKYSQVVKQKFHISMAALDASVVPTSPCISLMVERGGSEYLLCNLKPDSLLQVNLNLYFDKGEKIAFFLKGHGTVHLSGYLIHGENENFEDSGGIGRSEQNQVTISLTKDKKVKTGNVKTNEMYEAKESKKEKKGADLKKSAVNKTSKVAAMDEESSDEEEEDSSDDDFEDIKALHRLAQKRPHDQDEDEDSDEDDDEDYDDEDEEEEEDDEDEEDIEVSKIKSVKDVQNKKFKVDTSTPIQAKKGHTIPKKSTEVIDLKDALEPGDMNSSIGKTPMPKKQASSIFGKSSLNESKKDDMNSSVGRTPMPKKQASILGKNLLNESKKEKKPTAAEESDQTLIMMMKKICPSTSSETPSSKKKKKKKAKKLAASANESNLSVGDTLFKANGELSKAQYGKTLPGGVGYEDIRIGNGPVARKGKLVHVYYTGKLENNNVFDSCQAGSKPFAFKLGSGQVIKGWDLGVEGMRVGGKRRLKIPPQMGYNKQRTGPIPPNSTLYFIVELKAVS